MASEAARERTLRAIRKLTAGRPRRRAGKRVPPQQQPDAIRLSYFRAIEPVCALARREFAKVAPGILAALEDLRAERKGDDAARLDAGSGLGNAAASGRKQAALVDAAARSFADKFRPAALHAVVLQFGKRTDRFNQAQLDAQVRSAVGVSLSSVEKPIRDKLPAFAKENVALIVTVADRYFERLRGDVIEAYAGGTHPTTLAKSFADRYDVSLNDAKRIARDQIGKLNGELNQARQEAMGVDGYVWRGANDNRERDNHSALEGQRFSWDDPPMGGGTSPDEAGHPGSGIQCRCYSEPDFSALLKGL